MPSQEQMERIFSQTMHGSMAGRIRTISCSNFELRIVFIQ